MQREIFFLFFPRSTNCIQIELCFFLAVGVRKVIQLAAKLTSTGFKVTVEWTRVEAIKDTLKTLSPAPAFALSAQSINNTATVI